MNAESEARLSIKGMPALGAYECVSTTCRVLMHEHIDPFDCAPADSRIGSAPIGV